MLRLLWWLGLALSCVRADAVDTLYPDLKDPAVVHKPGYNATMMGHRRETRNTTSDGTYSYCSMPHPDVSFTRSRAPCKTRACMRI